MKIFCEKCNKDAEITIEVGMVVFKHGNKWCPHLNQTSIDLIPDIAQKLFNCIIKLEKNIYCTDDLVLKEVVNIISNASFLDVLQFFINLGNSEYSKFNSDLFDLLYSLNDASVLEILYFTNSTRVVEKEWLEALIQSVDSSRKITVESYHRVVPGFMVNNSFRCAEGTKKLSCLDQLQALNAKIKAGVMSNRVQKGDPVPERQSKISDALFGQLQVRGVDPKHSTDLAKAIFITATQNGGCSAEELTEAVENGVLKPLFSKANNV